MFSELRKEAPDRLALGLRFVAARMLSIMLLCAPQFAFATPGIAGSLDTTWAPATGAFGEVPGVAISIRQDYIRTPDVLALQADGKVIVGLQCTTDALNGLSRICLVRYTSTGVVDISFATFGIARPFFGGDDNILTDIKIQDDGKILVSGNCYVRSTFSYVFCFARFLQTGALDTGFGQNGIVSITFNGNAGATSLALLPDRKFLASGGCKERIFPSVCAVRFLENGQVDTAFNNNGRVDATFYDPANPLREDISHATSVVVRSDGGIIVIGRCSRFSTTPVTTLFCGAAFNSNGGIDVSYGNQGKVAFKIDNSGFFEYSMAALQEDDKLIVGANCEGGSTPFGTFCAIRLNQNGQLDAAFGNNGVVRLAIPGFELRDAKFTLQRDNKMVVAGQCTTVATSAQEMCAFRFTLNGQPDRSFGQNGRITIPPLTDRFSTYRATRSVAQQRDLKLLVAGACDASFCVARLDTDCNFDLDGNGRPEASIDGVALSRLLLGFSGANVTAGLNFSARAVRTSFQEMIAYRQYCSALNVCNGDIDGDGKQLATTDGLIALRAMLGVPAAVLLNGVNLPANATRKTPLEIRSYFENTCGMTIQ